MNMAQPWLIYTLADPRTMEVRYVGVTVRGQRRRLNEHLSRAATGGKTHRDCWIRSLLKLGLKPIPDVVEEGVGEAWREAERRWITKLNTTGRLVNLTEGGDGTPGYVPTEELRRKWSAMRRGVKYAPGRVSAMLGKAHSAEAREKIRAASTGRRHSESSRAKLSAAHKGKIISAEARAKMAEAKRGKRHTEEQKRKIAAATTSRKPVLSVETGEVYPSITAASKALKVTEASIYQALSKGCRCRGRHLRRV
jgi:group I intron endonuclease